MTNQTGPYANLVNTYDNNGNIESLYRNFEGKAVDVLDHIYANSGNRLLRVEDTGSGDADNSDVTDNKRYETFKPINGGTTGVDYNYYADGSLRIDPVKNTGVIENNYLNLPLSIPNQNISNTYDATGRKIQSNIAGVVYDYFAGVVFKNNKIEFIATPEGRVLPPNSVVQNAKRNTDPYNPGQDTTNLFWRYEYSLKDHLGNLRVACRCAENGASTYTTAEEGIAKASDGYAPYVVQQIHYDAWGVKLPLFRSVDIELNAARPYGGRPTDRYRYNGKEHIPQSGWYCLPRLYGDYGARMYDPAIARWNAIDPLAELEFDQSGFNYVGNNPLLFIDPTGMKRRKNKHGTWWDDEDNSATVYAKGPGSKTSSYSLIDLAFMSHTRNMAIHGEASPYGQHFQDGSNFAVGAVATAVALPVLASVPVVANGISAGASYVANLNYASAGRWLLRKSSFLLRPRIGLNSIGATADLGAQFLTNGHSLKDVNYWSVAGNLAFNNPLWSGAITTISADKTEDRTFTNFMINSTGNAFGNSPSLLLGTYSKVGFRAATVGAGAIPRANFMGNIVSRGVAESVKK